MKGRIQRPGVDSKLSLPRVGLIKTGFKDQRGFPKSTDYFIPTGKYAAFFTAAYGEKPNIIQIVFIEDDPASICSERFEYRDTDGRLQAVGDGETFEVWKPKAGTGRGAYETFSTDEHPDLMNRIQTKYPNKKGWEIILTLKFIIPKISGILGYWQFSTKGEASSIPQIRDTFDLVLKERGFIRGIIFDLTVSFATSQKPGIQSRYPVVSLVPNHSKENLDLVKNHSIGLSNSANLLGNGEN